MNLQQGIEAIDSFIQALSKEIPDIMVETAISGKSLIQNRIQESGINADGSSLGNYSEKDVPAFFFKGKSNNQGGESYIDAQIEEGGGVSYADFRRANGLQTNFIDLTFSGRMWSNIGVKNIASGNNKTTVTIGAKTDDNELKLFYSEKRFGDILQISKGEKEELELIAENRIETLAKRYLK
ncbi:MAG: hypothetical protein KC589_09255 [Nanoarchaeota archaeon]|nr:hypothetical protein [Nanoarchaeota archaeon]